MLGPPTWRHIFLIQLPRRRPSQKPLPECMVMTNGSSIYDVMFTSYLRHEIWRNPGWRGQVESPTCATWFFQGRFWPSNLPGVDEGDTTPIHFFHPSVPPHSSTTFVHRIICTPWLQDVCFYRFLTINAFRNILWLISYQKMKLKK